MIIKNSNMKATTSLLAFLLYSVFSENTYSATAQYTTLVWRNKEEFEAGGWTFPIGYDMIGYDKPSSFQPRDGSDLSPLDAESSDGVWGGSQNLDKFWFNLDRYHPSLCGFTEANLTVKMYFTRFTDVFINSCSNSTCRCACKPSPPARVEWVIQQFPMNQILDNTIIFHARVQNSNYFKPVLFDEVTLTHNGQDCVTPEPTDPPTSTTTIPTESPDHCNVSCEYRAVDCHNYYSCRDYSLKEFFTCPLSLGLAFNPTLGLCDLMENVEECQQPKCKCEYRPSPTNCTEFVFCSDSCREESCEIRSCPQGLVWSVNSHGNGENVQQCTVPGNATCFTGVKNDSLL